MLWVRIGGVLKFQDREVRAASSGLVPLALERQGGWPERPEEHRQHLWGCGAAVVNVYMWASVNV